MSHPVDAHSAPPGVLDANVTPGTIVGTVLHFTASHGTVDVTVEEDNAAIRDLLTMLPLTLTFEDFAGAEKIAYPPSEIDVVGVSASSAGAGDLALYSPWGAIVFYAGTPSEPTTAIARLGTFDATREQLSVLDHGEVTITIAD